MHLVSIYSEGYPHDAGKDMSIPSSRFAVDVRPHFQSVQLFTPRELSRHYPERHHMWKDYRIQVEGLTSAFPDYSFNPVWAAVGFLAWKVLAIQHALKNPDIREGELILYQDMDYIRYPSLTSELSRKVRWLENQVVGRSALFFSDYARPFESDIRPDLLVGLPKSLKQRLFPMPLWAGGMVLRKSEKVNDFLEIWANSLTWSNLNPFCELPKPTNFIWHSGEQSVLNLIYLQKHSLFQDGREVAIKYLWQSRDFNPKVRLGLAARVCLYLLSRQIRFGST